MEFRFPGFDVQRHYTPGSSSNYTYIPGGHATNVVGGTFIGDQLIEIHREIVKEQIREEIIAAEIERHIALEAEVRRIDHEMMALQSGGGFPSSVKLETLLRTHYQHHPFNHQMLHGEWFTPDDTKRATGCEIGGIDAVSLRGRPPSPKFTETTTYKPNDGNTGIIGLRNPPGATVPGSNLEAGLSPSLPAVLGSSGGDSNGLKKKITEEWNCMVCGVSASSKRGLSGHLSGKKHQAKMQALKAYINNDADFGSGEIKNQSSKIENSCKSGGTLSGSEQEAGLSPSPPSVLGLSRVSSNTSNKKMEECNCIACGINATSKCMLSDHLSGKKHQAQTESPKADNDGTDTGFGKIKKQSSKTENSCKSGSTVSGSKGEAGESPSPPAVLSSSGVSAKTSIKKTKGKPSGVTVPGSNWEARLSPSLPAVLGSSGADSNTSKMKITEEWNCMVCGVSATSERGLSEHLLGIKHQAQMQASKEYNNNDDDVGSGKIKKQFSKRENLCKSSGTLSGSTQEAGLSPSPSAVLGLSGVISNSSKKKTEEWNCIVCGIHVTSECMSSEHLSVKNHQTQMEASEADNDGTDIGFGKIKKQSSKTENSYKSSATVSGSKGEAGVLPSPPASKKIIKEEWNCIVCGIHATSGRMLSEHLLGKKHQAQMEAQKGDSDGANIGIGKIKKQSSKTENSCKSGATVSGSKGEARVSQSPPAVLSSSEGKPSGASVPGSNWKAGLSPSLPAVLGSSGGDSNASKKMIKEEWDCMVCGVSETSECGLSEHLSGIKHQAQMQASNAYNNNDADVGSGKIMNQSSKTENLCKSGGTLFVSKQEAGLSLSPPAVLGSSGVSLNTSKKNIKEEWNRINCGIHVTSEHTLSEHLSGKKHQAQMEASKAYNNNDDYVGFKKIEKHSNTESSCKSGTTLSGSKREAGVSPLSPAVLGSSGSNSNTSKKKIKEEWNCRVYGVSATSERGLREHKSGKKHQAQMEDTKSFNNNSADIGSGKIKEQPLNTENSCKSGATVSGSKREAGPSPSPPAVFRSSGGNSNTIQKKIKEWNCMVCGISATSKRGLTEHLLGKKHQAQMEALKSYNNSADIGSGKIKKQSSNTEILCKSGAIVSGSKREAGLSPSLLADLGSSGGSSLNTSKKKIKEEWNCIFCGISMTSKHDLDKHLSGKKHQAQMEASKACDNNDGDIESGKVKEPPFNIDNLCKPAPIDLKKDKKVTGEGTSKKFRFWCSMCRVGAQDEQVMSSHKNGKKHMANLLKKSRGKTKQTGRKRT